MPVIFQHIAYNVTHVHTIAGYAGVGFAGICALIGIFLVLRGIYRLFFKNVGMTSVADLGPAVNSGIGVIAFLAGFGLLGLSWTVLSMFYSG